LDSWVVEFGSSFSDEISSTLSDILYGIQERNIFLLNQKKNHTEKFYKKKIMNKFYLFLGPRNGSNVAWNKKKFYSEIEAYFLKQNIQIKQLDIRYTYCKYHAFITLFFASKEKIEEFNSIIQMSPNRYIFINDSWKIYQYIQKKDRLNTAFCEDSENDEVAVSSSSSTNNENVFEEEEEEEPTEVSIIEPEPEEEEEQDQYESIYTWLITPQQHELKQREDIASLCKWLATPYWERT